VLWNGDSFAATTNDRNALLRSIEWMPDAILGVEVDGKIGFTNLRADRLFDSQPGGLVGRQIESLLPARFRKAHLERRTQFFSKPHEAFARAHIQLYAQRLDGSEFPAEFSLAGIEVEGTSIALVAFRDTSDRLLTEQEQQLLNDELSLNQSRRLESIGALAGGIAHDFNNLLGVIINYAELAGDAVDDGATKADIDEIKDSALRAAALTRQLLIFSRRDSISAVPVAINELLEDLEKLLRRTIGEQIALRTKFAPDLWTVVADPGQLEQIVVNLAVNARDAMPSGGLLEIESSNVDISADELPLHPDGPAPGRYVRLKISDSGVGMDPAVVDRAFEPFFTTKQQGHGTGLGLATVYGIVKQAGGSVFIDSVAGTGTSVNVFLPCTDATVSATSDQPPQAPREGHGEQILVVEDEDAVRRLVERVLNGRGFKIQSCPDADAALQLLRDEDLNIQMLLSDVVMPGMQGSDLARRARELRPDIKVLLMSGYSEEMVARIDGRRDGFDLVEKPFTREQLLAAVNSSLGASENSGSTS
jgi:PAS domain S-box-containing protein